MCCSTTAIDKYLKDDILECKSVVRVEGERYHKQDAQSCAQKMTKSISFSKMVMPILILSC